MRQILAITALFSISGCVTIGDKTNMQIDCASKQTNCPGADGVVWKPADTRRR